MTTTPRGSPELAASQAVPETTVNEQIRRTEGGAGRYTIADRVTAPPGTSADGAQYIIIATATGAFAGKEGQIAQSNGTNAASGWLYRTLGTIDEGVQAYVQDEDVVYQWSGSAWSVAASGAAEATDSEVWVGSSTTTYVSPRRLYTASAPVALTSGATITPNGDNGFNFSLTIAHNATLANPSNFKTGQSGYIEITQDGTGSRTLAYGSNWKFPGGAPTLSTAAGSIDLISYAVTASGRILCTLSKAYA